LPERAFYGWTLLAALWGVAVCNLGFPAFGPAIINAAMAKALGMHRESLGDMFLVYMIMSGLPGPLVALSVNRLGVRKTLIAGCLLLVLGDLLMATAVSGPVGGMLCHGLLVGSGVAAGGILAAQAGLARWFVRRRSVALSILYSANAIGGFAVAPLLVRLIEASGTWRAGWWLLALMSCLAVGLVILFVRDRPEDLGQLPDGAAAPADGAAAGAGATGPAGGVALDSRPRFVTGREWSFREAVRNPTYWVLLIALLGTSGGYTLFLAHGALHIQDLGHSARVAAWAVSSLAASGLIGKLILAILGDRLDPRYLFALYAFVFGVGLLVIVDARAAWQVYLSAMCLGIGFGGGLVSLMAVLSNYYGTLAFASLAGVAFALNTTLSAFASKIGGRLFDQGVGYGIMFYFLAAWCFVGAVASCITPRPGVAAPSTSAMAGAEGVR
jgi:MFS family permease